MRNALVKLTFAICLILLLGPFKGSVLRASSNNWCSCDGYIHLYYTHPQYGPWMYMNQYEHDAGGSLVEPGPDGATACADACVDSGANIAHFALCDLYSDTEYPGQHYSVEGYYTFEDYDDTSGGNAQGGYNTGWTHGALYCP